jgi:hypothetical protein
LEECQSKDHDYGVGSESANGQPSSKRKNKHRSKSDPESNTSEKKQKEIELKGIPEEILEERKEKNCCLKCGKGYHRWYDCWVQEPVITSVLGGAKRKNKFDKYNERKAKVSSTTPTSAAGTSGRMMELQTVPAETPLVVASGRVMGVVNAEEDSDLDLALDLNF